MDSSINESKSTLKWQSKMLPFMKVTLAAITIFFFFSSFIQLFELQSKIDDYHKLELDSILLNMNKSLSDSFKNNNISVARWTTLALLEWNAMERRYHQANVSLMSRIWTRYLGFITGMILSIVGATFILGKLSELSSTVNLEIKDFGKFVLTSASPGLFLVTFGTILMIITIFVHHKIEVQDSSIYLQQWYLQGQDMPRPQKLNFKENHKDSTKADGDSLFEDL
jgi:hypothetical protein